MRLWRRLVLPAAFVFALRPLVLAQVEARPAVALTYQARLASPTPSPVVARRFLADQPAQNWFLAHRPDAYPALMSAALRAQDWERVLSSYDDPRLLREVVLSHEDDPDGKDPRAFLALVDRHPSLAHPRRFYEEVAMEWSAISDETRALLAEDGVDQKAWEGLDMPARYERLREADMRWADRALTAPVGSEEYARQYARVLERSTEGTRRTCGKLKRSPRP